MKHGSKQRGSILMISLIMLVVLTLLVISAMRSSNSNLRVVGNMQMQQEAESAAQQAVEQIISYNFTTLPASSVITVSYGTTDYTVTVPAPTCLGSTALSNNSPNLPTQCIGSGAATNTGIISASGVTTSAGQSWCYAQQWEVKASAVNASTGATATVHQGTALTVPAGTSC